MHRWMMKNVHKIKIKLENIWIDLIMGIYAPYTKYTETQVQFLGTQLKGNASEWFTRNIERPDRLIRDWSLESVIEGLQKRLLNLLMHRQASNKFNTIEQGQKTVQELIQDLTKYTA